MPGRTKVRRVPVLGAVVAWFHRRLPKTLRAFPGSQAYWEGRYADGGNSGVGSSGQFAEFKAEIINRFVSEHNVRSVLEFGCGDGGQLAYADYSSYLGFDVSKTAVSQCQERFAADPTKRFALLSEYKGETADLVLSLDVIYHLIEDRIFHDYMTRLFQASERFVLIYSSNSNDNRNNFTSHVRHRRFTDWVGRHAPAWTLLEHIPNRFPYKGDYHTGSFAEFFVYQKSQTSRAT